MKTQTIIPFRRKREGKTDYNRRLKLLKSNMPRLVIRKTLQNTIVQVIEYQPQGDKVIVGFDTQTLKKYGWKYNTSNIPAAYLIGYLIGKKALEKDIQKVVLDKGLFSLVKGSRIYASLKGAIDAGLKVEHGEEMFPSEDKIKGKHIADFAKQLKQNKEKYKKQYAHHIKEDLDPEKIVKNFKKTKENIKGEK